MLVLCTEAWYVNLNGFCSGGLDDGDNVGTGEDDGAGGPLMNITMTEMMI